MELADYRDRLQHLMDGIGMDRTGLAAQLGVSYQTVRKVFVNNAKFGIENNFKAAQFFGVSSDWLASGKGEMRPVEKANQKTDGPGFIEQIAQIFDAIPFGSRMNAYNAILPILFGFLPKQTESTTPAPAAVESQEKQSS